MIVFLSIVIYGMKEHHFTFFNLFVPKNVPKALLGFLIVIEVVSYLIRPFSLAIRLFANMLAGHTLMHIVGTFAFYLCKMSVLFAILPIIVIFAIVTLESFVVFIQAYVFCVLVCIYINDLYNLKH
jgi:ATP synthase subunit 6